MSTVSDSLAKLPASIQAFVQNTASHLSGNAAFGASEEESKEISGWLEVVGNGSAVKDLKEIDGKISGKTYLVGSSPSAADLALYAALHPAVAKLTPTEYYALPSLVRYVDHIQNLPSVRASSSTTTDSSPELITFDLENAPKLERVAEVSAKKKEKAAKAAATATPAATTSAPAPEAGAAAATPTGAKPKKEKKDKPAPNAAAEANVGSKKVKGNAQSAPGGATPAGTDVGEPQPSMIDLRVGKILQVARHPDADGLYVEQIDIGEETGPRTVVSGLVNYMPITELQDRTIIVVANLKPASMRGVKSFAMVLCATSKDGKEGGIEFVEPPAGSKPGERVYFDGDAYRDVLPVAQLNPKKKVFETIQPGFTTLDNRDAAWVDPATKTPYRIVTKDGPCRPKTLVGASLS